MLHCSLLRYPSTKHTSTWKHLAIKRPSYVRGTAGGPNFKSKALIKGAQVGRLSTNAEEKRRKEAGGDGSGKNKNKIGGLERHPYQQNV